jgi:hypothetical protein
MGASEWNQRFNEHAYFRILNPVSLFPYSIQYCSGLVGAGLG